VKDPLWLKDPGDKYRFKFEYGYSQSSPTHYWTVRTDPEGTVVRWDYHEDSSGDEYSTVVLKTTVERLDAKSHRLRARLGLASVKTNPEVPAFPFDAIFTLVEDEVIPVGESALDAIGAALDGAADIPRAHLKPALTALEYVHQKAPHLAEKALLILNAARDRRDRYAVKDKTSRSFILRLDTNGHMVDRYDFTGFFAAGSLTRLDSQRVVVGDLEPFRYRLLDVSSGKFSPVDKTLREKISRDQPYADLSQPECEWSSSEYPSILYVRNWSIIVAFPQKPFGPKKGFTLRLADYGASRPKLAVKTGDALVLAHRKPAFPVLSIDLKNGAVSSNLGKGPILALIRIGPDVWGLYQDRIVQYKNGRISGLELPLPSGIGTPQGFTPLDDGTYLVRRNSSTVLLTSTIDG
jgi:hypothetical protein